MKHVYEYDDKDQVFYIRIIGFYKKEEALILRDKMKETIKDKAFKQVITDLREAGKMENKETRYIINEALNHAGITDMAIVGAGAPQRILAKVMMKLTKIDTKMDFFPDTEKALIWLKNRRNK
jgi:hypothetical protein